MNPPANLPANGPALRPGADAMWAYAISAASTMLWVGCVLPAGPIAVPGLLEDVATPLHRLAILLVPALLLLIVGPVGGTLARTANGMRAVMAATDAFVGLYAGIALLVHGTCRGPTFDVLVGTLFLLGVLSILDVARALRAAAEGDDAPRGSGLRLAIAVLVLLTPSWLLVQRGCELASLLVPFAFLALGAGGARVARTHAGLKLAAATLHMGIAAHLVITLRYTIQDAEPRFTRVGPGGWAVLAASVFVFVLAALQVVVLARRVRAESNVARSLEGAARAGHA